MRTDYKIGIVAVVLVGLGITIWAALNSGPPPEEQATPADDDKGKNAGGIGGTDFYGRPADRVNESLTGDILGDRRGAADLAGRGRGTGAGMGALDDSSAGALEEARLAEARRRAAERALADRAAEQSAAASGREPDWWVSGTGAAGGAAGGASGTAATTYTVTEADLGFWTVAQKVYGDGKHWALIAQANPDAESDKLRAGQRLKVPPLPATSGSAASRRPDSTLNGQLVTRPDGKRYYHVQKGDAGFWAVSAKAYGNGKHWALIARANPGVTSGDLKEGQRLVVPPRPTEGVTGSGVAAAPARMLQPGQKWYTVVEGDAGFWDVAKKSYGNGKHWALIAQANPNVNSGRLRKGQKLVVPPLSVARRRATAPPTGNRVTRSDEPIFD